MDGVPMNSIGWDDAPLSAAQDIKMTYLMALRFVVAAPFLFLIPVAAEFLQHVAEIRAGMYVSVETFQANANHPSRISFAVIKVVALFLPAYYYSRFLGFKNDRSKYQDFSYTAISPFVPVFIFNMTLSLALRAATFLNPLAAWPGILSLALTPLSIYLAYWTICLLYTSDAADE